MSAPIAIDANIIVRYLTGDDKLQSPAATALFQAAEAGKFKLLVPTSVIQETVYVLATIYDLEAAIIAPKLISLLAIENVHAADGGWVTEALQFYRTKNCDFGDALLCAFAQKEKCEVATFDRGVLKKFPEVTARTPMDLMSGPAKANKTPQSN